MIRDVVGYCPMGCGQTLHLMPSNMIICLASGCPDSAAVTHILRDPETEHIVEVTRTGWNCKHPLRERIGDALLQCDIHHAIVLEVDENEMPPGRYRVTATPDQVDGSNEWAWENIEYDTPTYGEMEA